MKKILLFLLLTPLFSQSQTFTIYITDNRGNQNLSFNYLVTSDSLVITGLSDNGKTNVNYLHRKLTKNETKSLHSFLKDFPMEKINDTYFGEYANMAYISADHFPRVIEVRLVDGNRKAFTKITNAYVKMLLPLFDKVETVLPDEVKFRLNPADFGKVF
jgi:hypothetical protein